MRLSGISRLWRSCMWFCVSAIVLFAVVITGLRIALPKINQYQSEIEEQLQLATGLDFKFKSLNAQWEIISPSFELGNLTLTLPNETTPILTIEQAEVHIDVLASVLNQKPSLSLVKIDSLRSDVSRWPLKDAQDSLSSTPVKTPSEKEKDDAENAAIIKQLKNLFLRQLKHISITDSHIAYTALNGDIRELNIEKLHWKNNGNRHKADGLINVIGANLNKLSVIADFKDTGKSHLIDGDFYVSVQDVHLIPWLSHHVKDTTSIQSGKVSINSWISVKNGLPNDAIFEIDPSQLIWGKEKTHQLDIEHGVVKLQQSNNDWQINAHDFVIKTDGQAWPTVDVALGLHEDKSSLNVSQIELSKMTPFLSLIPEQLMESETTLENENLANKNTVVRQDDSTESVNEVNNTKPANSKLKTRLTHWLNELQPNALLSDIRVSIPKKWQDLTFSFNIDDVSLQSTEQSPEVKGLSAQVAGSLNAVTLNAQLQKNTLDFGGVVPTPIEINDAQLNLVLEKDELGWHLWSDKLTISSPYLNTKGEFKADFPSDGPAFLAFYAEADLGSISDAWRYFPTAVMDEDLVDYLASSLQEGNIKTAQLLWSGALKDYPYHDHSGIFQASLALRDAKFSFDTEWPPITDLQLDLLFENDALYMDSRSAKLMGIDGQHVYAEIPKLAPDGHITVNVNAGAEADDVRAFMMATPLIDSVGAALTKVQVTGPVTAELEIYVPFASELESKTSGTAYLKNNQIAIQDPAIDLDNATGKITFIDDKVKAKKIKAHLAKQPITLSFNGASKVKGYGVDINAEGNTDLSLLKKQWPSVWLKRLQGRMPWNMALDLQLNDVGYNFQLDSKAELEYLSSQYPAPLMKGIGTKSHATLRAAGNASQLSAQLALPDVKYQVDVDLTKSEPKLKASNLIIGKGNFKVSPLMGYNLLINSRKFNVDNWIELLTLDEMQVDTQNGKEVNASDSFSLISIPDTVYVDNSNLTLCGLDWHDVNLSAMHKTDKWTFSVDSNEATGVGTLENNNLALDINNINIYIPQWDEDAPKNLLRHVPEKKKLITDFEREFHNELPNLSLSIDDLWLQGYKVGSVEMDVTHEKDKLVWKKIDFKTGSNHLEGKGWWELKGNNSHSDFELKLTGNNNSEVMERFGINSGMQKASFKLDAQGDWQGSPWSVQTHTLNGKLSAEFEDGVITDVPGAARLLGLFSLDSIFRRIKLDFKGVFDDGMAFDSIKGTGKVTKGVFVTNNLFMDGDAGDLSLKGRANLVKQTVDAEVSFVPDLTSSIPLLAAFAVTPQAAVTIFAITTVVTPMIDVFTEIQYEIKGPLDSPEVNEISRSKGEFTADGVIPEK